MKKKYLIGGILCAILCLLCLLLLLPKKELTPAPPPATAQETDEYTCPVDFAALQKKNPDIYGWLSIPGTQISYPVVQNAEDDTTYLHCNADGEIDDNGALFTESEFNGREFSDPVTAIYGHNMRSGAMFGRLQSSFTDQFDTLKELVIYTPERELHYRVFAAVRYSKTHILWAYDNFTQPEKLTEFVQSLAEAHAIGNSFDESCTVTGADKLLVLSTCYEGDNTHRFLVVGKLIESDNT